MRQAEAEGLTLLRSDIGSSGYQGVAFRSGDTKPYQVQVQRGGKRVYLGAFATAEAAALCYARSVRSSDAKAVPSVSGAAATTKSSRRQVVAAAPETLLKAERRQKRKLVHLGYIDTAEEAALCYARMNDECSLFVHSLFV